MPEVFESVLIHVASSNKATHHVLPIHNHQMPQTHRAEQAMQSSQQILVK